MADLTVGRPKFYWNLIERLACETRGKWKVSKLAKYVVGLRKSNFQASIDMKGHS